MSNNLSELQKKYMQGLPLNKSRTHELNVIAAIKKKLTDFDYFLVKFLDYPNVDEFKDELKSIEARIGEYTHGNRD